MADIKIVITLLCKYLRQTVDATLKPEHFRLAKFNKETDNTVIELWKVLYQLSSCIVKELSGHILFKDYDDVTFVKLSFAFLQYPVPEFYALSLDSKEKGCSRELLLAFAWLLATQNVLNIVIDKKISSSILAEEFSDNHFPEIVTTDNTENSLSLKARLNRITHICGQINHNLRTISELINEEVKLVTKVHAASINASGLPHLSVSEMATVKRFAMNKFDADQCRLHELRELASALETREKWETKQHIFFDWMVTVNEEHKKSQSESLLSRESDYELSRFVCLLRHIIKKNLHNLKHTKELPSDLLYGSNCVSRFFRTQSSHTEAETWLLEMRTQLENEEESTKKKTDKLAMKLKKMLKLIPHCVQI